MAIPSQLTSQSSSSSVVVLPNNYGDLLTRYAKYRNSRTGGVRSTRTQIDHDVFEGLPVRHWRKRAIHVNTAPDKENMNDIKSRNLAWHESDMPRDAHLLSEMSQNLLRAARMPQAKMAAATPLLEDDKEPGEDDDADGEVDMGFIAKRWAVMPKDMEAPEPEFLAKRRKGLPSHHGGAITAIGGMQQMRKTKIRKVDSNGNSSVMEVLVPDGQTVDGEIFEEEASPTQVPAPGTVVQGVGVANAEGLVIAGDSVAPANSRRRPPPPKRRARGPGRGKKKKVAFMGPDGKPTSIEIDGVTSGAPRNEEGRLVDGAHASSDHDIAMDDSMVMRGGDQEGEENSEGSDEEEGEEGDREDGELSPSVNSSKPSSQPSSPARAVSSQEPQPTIPDSTVQRPYTPPMQTTGPIADLFNDRAPEIPSAIDPITQPVDDSETMSKPEVMDYQPVETIDEHMGEILDAPPSAIANESVGKNSTGTSHTPADDLINPAMNIGYTTESITNTSIDTAQHPASEPLEATSLRLEPSTEATPEHALIEAIQGNAETPQQVHPINPTDDTAHPSLAPLDIESTEEVVAEPAVEPPIAIISQPQAEAIVESSLDLPTEPNKGSKSESVFDVTPALGVLSEPKLLEEVTPEDRKDPIPEPPVEGSGAERAGPLSEPYGQPHKEIVVEPAETMVETSKEPVSENFQGPMTELATETIQEAAPPSNVEFPTTPTNEAIGDPLRVPVEEFQTESTSEPVVQANTEHFSEPMEETVERTFSFTRPTTSPKAPTPSPPTPIEEKFGLRAPYYSPKAPTMSPPTPLARSLPSSPEVPLSEQQFLLPPQLDDLPEGGMTSAPKMPDEHYPGGPQLHAQIPVDHNPLDGMAAPDVTYLEGNGSRRVDDEALAQFSDGEEDLLGSLERSLDRRGNGP